MQWKAMESNAMESNGKQSKAMERGEWCMLK
jgi:hypothetical protein